MNVEGEYYLLGQREMASGFLFNTDNTFQFFFSYGALDRQGSGQWKLDGDRVLLNSATKPLYDYALVESKKNGNDTITVKMNAGNSSMLNYVYCSLDNGAEGSWKQMNGEGMVEFPSQPIKNISLLFEFCPERFSIIPVPESDHNDFTFRFEPSLTEVYFQNFILNASDKKLSGGHPLMEGNKFIYERS